MGSQNLPVWRTQSRIRKKSHSLGFCLPSVSIDTSLPNQRNLHCSLMPDMCKYPFLFCFVLFFVLFSVCLFWVFLEKVSLYWDHGVLLIRGKNPKNYNNQKYPLKRLQLPKVKKMQWLLHYFMVFKLSSWELCYFNRPANLWGRGC